jgi:hypothetical protein
LKGRACSGKTTILAQLNAENGGVLLGMRQFMHSVADGAPFAIEEGFLRTIEEALAMHDLVIVDDLHLVTQVTHNSDYPMVYLLDAALTALLGDAVFFKKKLVFGTAEEAPWPILRRAFVSDIGEFQPDDYRVSCPALGENA